MRKFHLHVLQICPPHLSDVATLPWEIPKRYLQLLFVHTSDYLRYLRRKQTVIHLPHHLNVSLHAEVQNVFRLTEGLLQYFQMLMALKRASCGLTLVALQLTAHLYQYTCSQSLL